LFLLDYYFWEFASQISLGSAVQRNLDARNGLLTLLGLQFQNVVFKRAVKLLVKLCIFLKTPICLRFENCRLIILLSPYEVKYLCLCSSIHEGDEGSQSFISLPTSDKSVTRTKPPKDFVCPITSHIFGDPVTLETGQTFGRKAIQEWLERGNMTCPITRKPLSATTLPKTN
jgi:hypothetical protein